MTNNIDIRSEHVPSNSIVIFTRSGGIPSDYNHECSLFGKFIKNVPNGCTNPSTCVGGSTHQHPSGDHTHVSTPTSLTHTHTSTTSTNYHGGSTSAGGGGTNISSHSHTIGLQSVSSSLCVTGGTHQHVSTDNNIASKSVRFIRKNSFINIRNKNLPVNSIIALTSNNTTSLAIDTDLLNTNIKGVANACSSPLGTTSDSHSHNDVSHTHSISSSHSHTLDTNTGGIPGGNGRSDLSSAGNSHGTHGSGSGSVANSSSSVSSGSSTSHSHTVSLDVAHVTTKFVRIGNIELRNKTIPVSHILLWSGTLASIPQNYSLDSSNFDKYPKGILCQSATPGTQSGSNSHEHSGDGGHTHTSASFSHSHTVSGSTTSAPSGNTTRYSSAGGSFPVSHTHTYGTSNNSSVNVSLCSSNHTHTSVNHEPVGKTVAFIKRL